MKNVQQGIPAFSLYGEQTPWPTPDLLHCETIAYRSRQYDWKIAPHRHNGIAQLLYLASGVTVAQLDGREVHQQGPCVILVPEPCVHGFRFAPTVKGYVISIAAPLLRSIQERQRELEASLTQPAVHQLQSGKTSIASLTEHLAQEYVRQQPDRDAMLQSLATALLLSVGRELQARETLPRSKLERNAQRFGLYEEMVEQHFRSPRPLPDYASVLGISTAYLNSICRTYCGHSALQLIHQRRVLEAKRLLVYSAKPVSLISEELGFADPAYFTRFFHRHTGQPPSVFRDNRGRTSRK